MSTLARALPAAWFSLFLGTHRRTLVWIGILAIAAIPSVLRPLLYPQIMLALGVLAPIGLGSGSVNGDRVSGRSALFFQRAVSPRAHYLTRLGISIAILASAALFIGVAATVLNPAARPWVDALWALYWAVLLLIVATALSTVVPRNDAILVPALFMASLAQGLVLLLADYAVVRETLQWVLLPVDAALGSWSQWRSGQYAISTKYAVQLVLQPVAWLTLLMVRLRTEDLSAALYHER